MTPLVSKKRDKATGCRKNKQAAIMFCDWRAFIHKGCIMTRHTASNQAVISVKFKHPCCEGRREIHVATPNQYCCAENPSSEEEWPHKFHE